MPSRLPKKSRVAATRPSERMPPLVALMSIAALMLITSSAAAQEGSGAAAVVRSADTTSVTGTGLERASAGDEAFDAGDFSGAIRHYRASGVESASVHYNLGLSYAHLDQFGEATFHLTQAHFLDLSAGEIQDSLALVRAEADRQRAEASDGEVTRGVPDGVFWLEFFHRVRGLSVDIGVLAACWLAFGLLLWRRRAAAGALRDAVLVTSVLLLVGIGLGVTYRVGAAVTAASVRPGVITARQPLVYSGPDRSAPRHVEDELSVGALVLIEERRDEDWVRVALSDGGDGWLREGDIREVRIAR